MFYYLLKDLNTTSLWYLNQVAHHFSYLKPISKSKRRSEKSRSMFPKVTCLGFLFS